MKYSGRRVQALRHAVVAAWGLTCHLCGQPIASLREMEVDHVVPRSLDPAAAVDLANLRPVHGTYSLPKCNQRRGNRSAAEFRRTRDVDNGGWFADVR